jgi:hypothetical protein
MNINDQNVIIVVITGQRKYTYSLIPLLHQYLFFIESGQFGTSTVVMQIKRTDNYYNYNNCMSSDGYCQSCPLFIVVYKINKINMNFGLLYHSLSQTEYDVECSTTWLCGFRDCTFVRNVHRGLGDTRIYNELMNILLRRNTSQ